MSKQVDTRHRWAWFKWHVGDTVALTGDDLDASALDDLWAVVNDAAAQSTMADWWRDKPHQILNRLLCKLTRAEQQRAELADAMWAQFMREVGREKLPDTAPAVVWTHNGWQHDAVVLGGWSAHGFHYDTFTDGSAVAWADGTRLRWVWAAGTLK